jgi:hypothetical protein
VEPELEAPAIPAENALGEAFDFLNAVWELHFKRPLLRLRSLAADGRLALPCRNRGEFDNAMSALDDLLKLLDIADDLLPEGKRGIPKDHTFARLQALLEPGLEQGDKLSGGDHGGLIHHQHRPRIQLGSPLPEVQQQPVHRPRVGESLIGQSHRGDPGRGAAEDLVAGQLEDPLPPSRPQQRAQAADPGVHAG